MRILLSNDDGYQAPGLRYLAQEIKNIADVVIVAPERNRSGSSSSLTLDTPLRAIRVADNFHYVNGTPTDCVHLAITGFLKEEPQMVVSGINAGANLGDDVIYSGTVAAAIEGRFLGLPAIAISLASRESKHYETAALAAGILVKQIQQQPLPAELILNVNVPDLPWKDIAGFQATRLGHRYKADATQSATDPLGRTIYWVGGAGPERDAGIGTDFFAISQKYISVTPLHVDLTRHNIIDQVAAWLKEI